MFFSCFVGLVRLVRVVEEGFLLVFLVFLSCLDFIYLLFYSLARCLFLFNRVF